MRDEETTTSAQITQDTSIKKHVTPSSDYDPVNKSDEKLYKTRKVRAKRIRHKTF